MRRDQIGHRSITAMKLAYHSQWSATPGNVLFSIC